MAIKNSKMEIWVVEKSLLINFKKKRQQMIDKNQIIESGLI